MRNSKELVDTKDLGTNKTDIPRIKLAKLFDIIDQMDVILEHEATVWFPASSYPYESS